MAVHTEIDAVPIDVSKRLGTAVFDLNIRNQDDEVINGACINYYKYRTPDDKLVIIKEKKVSEQQKEFVVMDGSAEGINELWDAIIQRTNKAKIIEQIIGLPF